MDGWIYKNVLRRRLISDGSGTTPPEFMHTLSSPKLARALCEKNPKEDVLLKKRLEKIERSRKTKHLDLSWDQREFFIKSVFDDDNEPRFVKVHGTDRSRVTSDDFTSSTALRKHSSLTNLARDSPQLSRKTVKCQSKVSPHSPALGHKNAYSVKNDLSLGLFLPPVKSEKSRTKSRAKSDIVSLNANEISGADSSDLSDDSDESCLNMTALPDIQVCENLTDDPPSVIRKMYTRRRSISMHNLSTAVVADDNCESAVAEPQKLNTPRSEKRFQRRRSISCNDLPTLLLSCDGRHQEVGEQSQATEVKSPLSEDEDKLPAVRTILVRSQTCPSQFPTETRDVSVTENATMGKPNRRAETAPRLRRSRSSSTMGSVDRSSTPSSQFRKDQQRVHKKNADKPLCDTTVINKLTTSLPEHLYRKAKLNAMKVAESEGVLDAKEKLLEKSRSISSMNALHDPRWKRLEEALQSPKTISKKKVMFV